MKLNEGRIGRQEAASLAAMGLVGSAVFYPNAAEGYRYGNSNYIAAPLAFLLLLLLFFVIVRSMKRRSAEHLGAFLTDALGGLFGRVAALAVVAFLVLSAAIPLIQFQLLLKRFVFPDSLVSTICLYFLPPMLLLACMGLETLGRTARMLFWLFAIAFVLPMLIPISAYETYHLFPLPMENPVSIVQSAVRMAAQGMPAVLALLIYADGVQGVRNAEKYGYIVILGGGLLVILLQLCISLTFSYLDLREIISPLYRLLMSQRSGVNMRLDKLVLFSWIAMGILSVAGYLYAAALLLCRTTGIGDVRPPALSFSAVAASLALLVSKNTNWTNTAATLIVDNLYLLALAPPLLAAAAAFFRKERLSA